ILLLRLSGLLHIRSETIYLLVTNWLHPNRIFVGLPDRLLPAGSMGHWQSVDVVLPIALEPLFATRQIMPRYDQFVRPWKYKLINRKSTRLNSSHVSSSYAVVCLKKKRQARWQPKPTPAT